MLDPWPMQQSCARTAELRYEFMVSFHRLHDPHPTQSHRPLSSTFYRFYQTTFMDFLRVSSIKPWNRCYLCVRESLIRAKRKTYMTLAYFSGLVSLVEILRSSEVATHKWKAHRFRWSFHDGPDAELLGWTQGPRPSGLVEHPFHGSRGSLSTEVPKIPMYILISSNIIYPLVNKHRPWKSPIFNGN